MSKNSNITKEEVLNALRTVQEPELHKDLVTLNMIKDIQIDNGKVKFTVVLTTPACPLKNEIKTAVEKAVMGIPGVRTVEVKLDAEVPSDGRTRGLLELPIRNAVAVASGKGGVGKSTIAVNLAVVLAQSGPRVGLLDADIYGPNIPTMMGVKTLPPVDGDKLIPAEAYGVKIMSIGFMVKADQPLIWRGPMLHSAIRQFLTDVSWGELDYLIIDLPPGTGDAALSLAQSLPLSGGVIVTLPQQVSLDDARRGLEMFRQLDVEIFGVVDESGVPFIGTIPIDPSVRKGGDTGNPVVASNPESAVAKAIRVVAEKVAARTSIAAVQSKKDIKINIED